MFPVQAVLAGLVEIADLAIELHLPQLRFLLKFDGGSPANLQATEFMERNGISPETTDRAIQVELQVGFHIDAG